jgi:hypothetical protein
MPIKEIIVYIMLMIGSPGTSGPSEANAASAARAPREAYQEVLGLRS